MTAQIIPPDPNNARALARHATEIQRLGKQVVSDVIEIGRLLVESKGLLDHGDWLPWLSREFKWTGRTAERFMQVHSLFLKNDNLSNLDIPLSGLYLLAAPSTPEVAKREAISRAEAGEPIPLNTVKEIVGRAKQAAPADTERTPVKRAKRSRKLLKAGTVVEVDLKYAQLIGGGYRGPIKHITDCGGNCDRMPDGNYHYTINVPMIVSDEHLKWVRKAEEQVEIIDRREGVMARLDPAQVAAVDEWRRQQPDIPPRAEAVVRLMEMSLDAAAKPRKPNIKLVK